MATMKQGIFGAMSGRVGNVVFSSWKGVPVAKQRPASVANPQTAAQTEQRNAMTGIVAAARTLLAAIIQPFWNPFAQGQSGYNAFVSENIATFDENGLATPENFYSMRGSLLGVAGLSASANAATDVLNVSWTNNSGQADALSTDQLVVVVYNRTQKVWLTEVALDTRGAGPHAVSIPGTVAGNVLDVYVSFARPNRSKVSDSAYISVTAV